jgi:phage-related protein
VRTHTPARFQLKGRVSIFSRNLADIGEKRRKKMAESIVKVPSTASGDFDFLGFSFAGKHSWDDFGIYRTSDGDRYNDELAPPMQDLTAEVPGGDGQYYFGTFHKPKVFNVNFAFDNMSEITYREMKKWLNGKEMGDLWFEEAPYKVYTAKVTGTPQMKSLCFDAYNEETKKMERVYKGDGTIQFTAYWPYAHTPDKVQKKIGSTWTDVGDGKISASYNEFGNKD